jgi:molybdate transport system permease protein
MKCSTIAAFTLAFLVLAVIITGCFSVSIDSLLNILKDEEFYAAVMFSLETSVLATGLSFILGVPAGLYLSKSKGILGHILDTVFDIPIVVPPLIVGVLFLSFFNLSFIKDAYSFIFSFWGAVIVQFFIAVPLTIKSSKSSFGMVPPVYEMIATTLGKRPLRAFWDTTFKIALPGIFSGLTLTWMRCVGEFGATLMVGGGIPFKTENIPVNIYLNITAGDYRKGLSASIVTIIIAFICILLMRVFYSINLKKRKNDKTKGMKNEC